MKRKQKNALIGGLLAIVFVMAVGYAAFATTLNISSTASVSSKWDVHIKSITAVDSTGTGKSTSATVGSDGLSATFNTELTSPADSVMYEVEVENSGNLDAKLSKLTLSDTSTTDPIIYSTSGIAENDTITAGSTTSFSFKATYNEDITSQPTTAQLTKSITMTLTFVQA